VCTGNVPTTSPVTGCCTSNVRAAVNVTVEHVTVFVPSPREDVGGCHERRFSSGSVVGVVRLRVACGSRLALRLPRVVRFRAEWCGISRHRARFRTTRVSWGSAWLIDGRGLGCLWLPGAAPGSHAAAPGQGRFASAARIAARIALRPLTASLLPHALPGLYGRTPSARLLRSRTIRNRECSYFGCGFCPAGCPFCQTLSLAFES
jgi:hypothetical protein